MAVILSTTVMIQLSNKMDLRYIFIMIGSIVSGIAVLLFFGIKDIHKSDAGAKSSNEVPLATKVATIFRDLYHSVQADKILVIAFLGHFAHKIG